jgi:hypothetical protein
MNVTDFTIKSGEKKSQGDDGYLGPDSAHP